MTNYVTSWWRNVTIQNPNVGNFIFCINTLPRDIYCNKNKYFETTVNKDLNWLVIAMSKTISNYEDIVWILSIDMNCVTITVESVMILVGHSLIFVLRFLNLENRMKLMIWLVMTEADNERSTALLWKKSRSTDRSPSTSFLLLLYFRFTRNRVELIDAHPF